MQDYKLTQSFLTSLKFLIAFLIRLLIKLMQLNIHPNVVAWIKELGNNSPVLMAVLFCPHNIWRPPGQRTWSPTFLNFMDDLPKCVSSRTGLFADDCVIYCNITNDADSLSLHTDLDVVIAWCSS